MPEKQAKGQQAPAKAGDAALCVKRRKQGIVKERIRDYQERIRKGGAIRRVWAERDDREKLIKKRDNL